MTRWILDPAGALDSPHAGGKARALARAERGGLSVPAWIVLSDSAFFDALTAGQRAAGTPTRRLLRASSRRCR